MSLLLVSFIASLSAGAWLYSKFFRRTGGNNQTAIIGSAVIAIILFIVLYLALTTLLPK